MPALANHRLACRPHDSQGAGLGPVRPLDYTSGASPVRSSAHGEDADGHMKALSVRGEEVSPTSAAARGLPLPATAWKGMGPSGYHKPPTLARSSYLGYLLILCVVFMSVEGSLFGPGGSGSLLDAGGGIGSSQQQGRAETVACKLAHCSDAYHQASDELYVTDPTLANQSAICRVVMDYKACVWRASPGCRADLTYHMVRQIIEKKLATYECPEGDEEKGIKPKPGKKRRKPLKPPAMCVYQGPQVYRHCGLFGDPHLRTFHGDFQTCKVKGAWPLVNNHYLTVQVTNDPVEGNVDVTATSKLTVIVKSHPECTKSNTFHTYSAESGDLPGAFEDGSVQVGPYHSVEVVQLEAGAHVEIHVRYINTVVSVRRIGRYLTFSLQMPESLINTTSGDLSGGDRRGFPAGSAAASSSMSLSSSSSSSSAQDVQLCLRGCPESELINFQEYLAARRYSVPERSSSSSATRAQEGVGAAAELESSVVAENPVLTRAEAEAVCREAEVVGFYFDFCVFDLLATGDRNFTLSAVGAMRDVLRLDPAAARRMENRTSLEKYDHQFARDVAAPSARALGAASWWRTSLTGIAALVCWGGGGAGGLGGGHTPSRSVLVFLLALTLLLMLCSR